jgi:CTP synthase (UTP-ammonia lyase)
VPFTVLGKQKKALKGDEKKKIAIVGKYAELEYPYLSTKKTK